MKIVVKGKLFIYDAPSSLITQMKRALTLPNPTYEAMVRRVKAGRQGAGVLYALKKDFKYYQYDSDRKVFECGRGVLPRLIKWCKSNNHDYEIDYEVVDTPLSQPLEFKGELRDYQKGSVEKILQKGNEGVLRLDTAWGKTVLSCALISGIKQKTLIIVPLKIIMEQFIDTIDKFLGYKPGIIQGKTKDFKDVTVAMAQTLNKIKPEELKDFGMVLVDECHNFITKQRLKTLESLAPKHLYGLTGTADRDDGQGEAIFFTFGPKLIDKKMPQEKPTVYRVKTNLNIDVSPDYHEIVDNLIENEERNILIKNLAEREVVDGRKIIILTKRIAHSKIIEELLNEDIKTFVFDSKTKNKEEIFNDLRNGKIDFDVVIGTFSLLSTGINLEMLSSVIFAGDIKSKILVAQGAGRALRSMLNKPNVHIIDMVDNRNGLLNRQALNRRKVYLEKGWEIIDTLN